MQNSRIGLKMVFILLIATLSVTVVIQASSQQHYEGDQVLSIDVPSNDVWLSVLAILKDNVPAQDIDIWAEPRIGRRPAYVLIRHRYLEMILNQLQQENINFKVSMSDVQRLIDSSTADNDARRLARLSSGKRDINGTFPRYDELLQWMEDTTEAYPELASTFSIGQTYENRPMQILKLGLPGVNKWRVWLDAGLHAREWLAPTTAIYVADQLIDGYVRNDITVMQMLNMFDFHIMPIANPDGYEYCHTGERLWRKNRRPVDGGCMGVDLNRNFDFQWGGVNADINPCSNLYMGPYAESEIEVQHIVNYIQSEASKYLMYYAYHTWGELFFTRWDYTNTNLPADHQELFDLAARAVNSINFIHGETYEAGLAPELMYAFAGSSSDWARGVANIKYPFLTELRDYDGGYAFVAPPTEIQPCGEENWAGLQAVLVEIMQKWAGTHPPE